MSDESAPTNIRDELRDELFKEMLKRVREGETITVGKEGDTATVSCGASTLSAAINLLKAFPPGQGDSPEDAAALSSQLQKYAGKMKFGRGAH